MRRKRRRAKQRWLGRQCCGANRRAAWRLSSPSGLPESRSKAMTGSEFLRLRCHSSSGRLVSEKLFVTFLSSLSVPMGKHRHRTDTRLTFPRPERRFWSLRSRQIERFPQASRRLFDRLGLPRDERSLLHVLELFLPRRKDGGACERARERSQPPRHSGPFPAVRCRGD